MACSNIPKFYPNPTLFRVFHYHTQTFKKFCILTTCSHFIFHILSLVTFPSILSELNAKKYAVSQTPFFILLANERKNGNNFTSVCTKRNMKRKTFFLSRSTKKVRKSHKKLQLRDKRMPASWWCGELECVRMMFLLMSRCTMDIATK